jgi:fatty acid kinase fatty acid binding subunit
VELTADNTAVVLDSTADYPDGPKLFPNWRIVPLYVRFGADTFRDYVELGPDAFYERLRTATELPSTSQPTPADFLAVYRELEAYERVLSLHIPLNLSGTVQSARVAADELGGGKVRAIDSGTVSAGLALLARVIQERLERGTTDDEVDALVERFQRESRIVFTVDTLEFLAKGGRIGKAAAMAGTLLNIKPILAIERGEVVPLKRVRGAHKAFLEFVEAFEHGSVDRPTLRAGIAHADARDRLEALRELVRRTRPQAQVDVETTLGAVVGTHAGPGAVGLFWFDDAES